MAQTRPVSLITGSNRGIGFEIGRQLARAGHRVILASRTAANGEAAVARLAGEGLEGEHITIDICSQQTVDSAVDHISRRYGVLDTLINNAGVSEEGKNRRPSETSLDLIRATIETNTIGSVRMMQAMLPLLAKSSRPQIINLSSEVSSLATAAESCSRIGVDGFDIDPDVLIMAYAISKAALNAASLQFAVELKSRGIAVNVVCPGYTATDMTHHRGRPVGDGAAIVVRLATAAGELPTATFSNDSRAIPW